MSLGFQQKTILGAITELGGAAIETIGNVEIAERNAEVAIAQSRSLTFASITQQNQMNMVMIVGAVLAGLYILNR